MTDPAMRDRFAATLEALTGDLGFRLDRISPADGPTRAELSARGITIAVTSDDHVAEPPISPEPPETPLVAAQPTDEWVVGRAGMRYRDLIPGRLGGWCIGSNIEVCDGGPVPDFVHHHAIRFQLIACQRGWVDVVYQDQGPPFRMEAGDLVLQPPHIRHRVLASSPGARVVELGCPAVHDTLIDHELELPTTTLAPDRDFGGQRFVRHIGSGAAWVDSSTGFRHQRTAVGEATGGLAEVGFFAADEGGYHDEPAASRVRFLCLMRGGATLSVGAKDYRASEGFAITLPPNEPWQLSNATPDLLVLSVTLPDA